MRGEGNWGGFFAVFAAVLGTLAALLAIVSPLPFWKAIPVALVVSGLAALLAIQIQRGPRAPWRDRHSIVALAGVAIGVVAGVVVWLGSEATTTDHDPWGPLEALTSDRAFTGATRMGEVMARGGSEPFLGAAERLPGGRTYDFEGFCLQPPYLPGPADRRWFVVRDVQLLFPAREVEGNPPPGSLPQSCTTAERSVLEPSLEMQIGREFEFIEGIKAPWEPDSAFSYALGAFAEDATEVGFAALTASEEWIGLGLGYKPATPYSFALILPSALSGDEIDRAEPVKVLAVRCYAPGVPGSSATVGEVELEGLRPPVLLGQRVLRAGAATTARETACTKVQRSFVG